jgi:hypothetical protein
MPNLSDQGDITWQAVFWRLVLTAIILFVIAGSGLTIFSSIIGRPDAQVLPTATFKTGIVSPSSELGLE